MKIRIKGNTVRYRLSKPEVISLANNGTLEEQTDFFTNPLTYAIQQSEKKELSADFNNNTITLYIPQIALQQWANTDQVGIEANMLLTSGKTLYLLLEKDFKCTDAYVLEDQSDYFENPNTSC